MIPTFPGVTAVVQDPPQINAPNAERKGQPSKSSLFALLDNRWAVLAAIFLAMMFLGLPLLWRCPAFTRFEKFVWTVVVLVYSFFIFWAFFWVMAWSYGRISESLGIALLI